MATAALPAVATYVFTKDLRGSATTAYVGMAVAVCVLIYESIQLFLVAGRDLLDEEKAATRSAKAVSDGAAEEVRLLRSPRPYISLDVGPDPRRAPFKLKAAPEGITATNVHVMPLMFGARMGAFRTPTSLRPGESEDLQFRSFDERSVKADDFVRFIRDAVSLDLIQSNSAPERGSWFTQLQHFDTGSIATFRISVSYNDYQNRMFADLYDVTAVYDHSSFEVKPSFIQSLRSDFPPAILREDEQRDDNKAGPSA